MSLPGDGRVPIRAVLQALVDAHGLVGAELINLVDHDGGASCSLGVTGLDEDAASRRRRGEEEARVWDQLDRVGVAITSPLTRSDLSRWEQDLERRGLSHESRRVGERAMLFAVFPSELAGGGELDLALDAAAARLERLLGPA